MAINCPLLPDKERGLALVGEVLQRLGQHHRHVPAVHFAESKKSVRPRLQEKKIISYKNQSIASRTAHTSDLRIQCTIFAGPSIKIIQETSECGLGVYIT